MKRLSRLLPLLLWACSGVSSFAAASLPPIDPTAPVTARGSTSVLCSNGDRFLGLNSTAGTPVPGIRPMAPPRMRAPAAVTPDAVARAAAPAAAALTDYPPEIQNLVRACGGDPLKLFNLVRNEVRFQPYRGFRKGPVLTWQTKAGSDADQAWLLVELLRAAGYTADFYYGVMTLPRGSSGNLVARIEA